MNTDQGADFVEETRTSSRRARELAILACRAVDLPSGGVDLLIDEESGRHVLLEVNQNPMLKGNVFPFYTKSPGNRVAEAIIDLYFPASIDRRRLTKASFDFTAICAALRSGAVSEVTLPVLADDWVHKRLRLPIRNMDKSAEAKLRAAATMLGLHVDLFKSATQQVVLEAIGPAERLDRFVGKLKDRSPG